MNMLLLVRVFIGSDMPQGQGGRVKGRDVIVGWRGGAVEYFAK